MTTDIRPDVRSNARRIAVCMGAGHGSSILEGWGGGGLGF